jgi:hypothetical protein
VVTVIAKVAQKSSSYLGNYETLLLSASFLCRQSTLFVHRQELGKIKADYRKASAKGKRGILLFSEPVPLVRHRGALSGKLRKFV